MRAALFLLLAACASGRPIQVQVLLDRQLAQASGVGALKEDFDLTPDRMVLLSDDAHLRAVGWGGAATVEETPACDSFAYTETGRFVGRRGASLIAVDGSALFDVPDAGMALARGPGDSAYLFDRGAGSDGRYAVFRLEGKRALKLFDSPRAVDAVAQDGGRIFFASGGAVFEASEGRPLRLVAAAPKGRAIRSVAAASGRVYFADERSVYVLRDGELAVVLHAAAATLRARPDALFVLEPAEQLLLRISPLP